MGGWSSQEGAHLGGGGWGRTYSPTYILLEGVRTHPPTHLPTHSSPMGGWGPTYPPTFDPIWAKKCDF